MASLPPSSTQRRRGPQHDDPPTASQTNSSPTVSRQNSRSTPSPDTPQTLYLNDISCSTETQPPKTSATANTASGRQLAPQPTPVSEGDEPRKCWICFSDETEDDPMSSQWRSPCPCALTAHESCLLDWIADLQAPGSRKRMNPSQKILCPQCKSEIHIERPRSMLVDVVNTLDRAAGRVVIPGIIGALGGCIWTGCMVFGINTVHVIFGMEDASKLLPGAGCALTMYRALNPFVPFPAGWGWRLRLGLPLIPIVLVLSRSNIADSVLPILPIIFFATQSSEHERLDLSTWPPSAPMTLAALPYLRGFYNEVYERSFGAMERRWVKEIQPRSGESTNDAGIADRHAEWAEHDMGGGGDEEGEEVIMQVNVEVDVDLFNDNEEDEGDEPELPVALPPAPAAQGAAADGAQQPAPQQAQRARQNNLVISTTHLADTILGALLFPTASAAMGVLLKLVLPRSWTTAPDPPFGSTSRKGLLQAKWGRSIVGGCLFVVLKDALVLYTKYRRAQQHRERRVVDYKGSKGRRNR
ncbi:hypothetical protein FGG08_002909 [Glutinoglossum americanum]|uniref:RING-CH-type domain-containing protein n=1 Tax=Glutinoglossum americanum TaxID=1670608 RepID=A0A9P8KYP0_9PEZI|nr:hypothetical protein FGG08_002909 [Glutinoglossum americanum]